MKLKLLILLALLTCTACGTSGLADNNKLTSQPNAPLSQDSPKQSPAQLEQLARGITVKVIAANNEGSGTLIKKEDDTYTVVTNNHILKRADSYQVQTADGRIYTARLLPENSLDNYDLALLQFASEVEYQFLPPGGFSPMNVGDSVFAAGYAYDADIAPGGDSLNFTGGKVSQISEKTFNGGYEIGYTNEIVKGMSGGPLLDGGGELIGINGVLANPLFGNPYRFDDGSVAGKAELEKLTGSSWGISMASLVDLLPELDPARIPPEYVTPPLTGLAARVDEIAEEITVRIEDDDGNGSGVIIARRGNVYYVLTAQHVFRNPGNYRIATHDGKVYPVDYEEVKFLRGADLAVATFTVPSAGGENYRVATFGDYSLKDEQYVFVSGWPGWRQRKMRKPGRLLTAGLVWSQEQGVIKQTSSFYALQAGYELTYTNLTHGGMSGGAVLDSRGRLIGIHAATEAEYLEDGTPIQLGHSLGVPVDRFLAVVDRVEVKSEWLQVEKSPPGELSDAETALLQEVMLAGEAPGNGGSAIDWLKYGNQLWRKREFDGALAAFDRAIKLEPDLHLAWYGKGMALSSRGKFLENREDDLAAVESFDRVIQLKPKFYKGWRQRGRMLVVLEKYEEALASFDEAIALNPKSDFLLHGGKGMALLFLTRYEEAIDAYTDAIKINPDHSWFYTLRGSTKSWQGDYQGAIADFNRAIALNPQSADAYLFRASTKSNQRDYKGAIADYNRAIAMNPDNVETYYIIRGALKVRQGDIKGAIDDYNQAIAINPDDVAAYTSLGGAKKQQGDLTGAMADYDKAIAIKPKDAKGYFNRGMAKSQKGDHEGAIADLNQAIAINSQLAPIYSQIAPMYSARGLSKKDLGDLTGAIADFDKAIAIEPNDASTYKMRGDALHQQGDIKGAIADYNQAIGIKSDDVAAYTSRGDAKKQQGDLTGAMADYDRAIAIKPKNAVDYWRRGLAKYKKGDIKGAIADFDTAIAINPNDANIYWMRGIFKQEQGDLTGAIADYKQAIEIDPKLANVINPNLAKAYYNLGDAKFEQKDLTGAIADLEQGIEIEPEYAQAHFALGFVRHHQEDLTGAIADYNRAVKINEKAWYSIANIGLVKYEWGEVEAAIQQWQQALAISSQAAQPQLALAVALYAKGDSEALAMAEAALKLDSSLGDVENLRKNLWGEKLIADAQKLFETPRIQALLSQAK